MSAYQLLECQIALSGDILNVVARHAYIPVTFPELLVLRYLHGQNSVTEVFDCGAVERDDEDEFKRLMETYGEETVRGKLFPGAGTRLPNGDNRYKPRLVIPDKVLPASPVEPEVVHAPGTVNYASQQLNQGPAAFVPSSDPVPDPDSLFDPTPPTEGNLADAFSAQTPGQAPAGGPDAHVAAEGTQGSARLLGAARNGNNRR